LSYASETDRVPSLRARENVVALLPHEIPDLSSVEAVEEALVPSGRPSLPVETVVLRVVMAGPGHESPGPGSEFPEPRRPLLVANPSRLLFRFLWLRNVDLDDARLQFLRAARPLVTLFETALREDDHVSSMKRRAAVLRTSFHG